jgi:hypothetical protein
MPFLSATAGDRSLPTAYFCETVGVVAAKNAHVPPSGTFGPSPNTYRRKAGTVGLHRALSGHVPRLRGDTARQNAEAQAT